MRKLLLFFTGSPAANNSSGVYANEYLRNGQTENGGLCCSQFVTRSVLYRRTAKKLFVSTVILASTYNLYAQMPPYYDAPYFHSFQATNFSANIDFSFAKYYAPTLPNNNVEINTSLQGFDFKKTIKAPSINTESYVSPVTFHKFSSSPSSNYVQFDFWPNPDEVDINTNLQGFNFKKIVKAPSIDAHAIEAKYINIHSNYTNNTNSGRLFHVASDYHPHMLTICYNGEVGIGMDPAFYAAKLSVKGSVVIHDGDLGINGGRIGMQNDKLTFSAQNGFHFNGSTRVEGQLRIGMSHLAFSHSSGEGVINFGNVTNKSCPRPDTMGNLWFRSLPEAGNINTFNQLMILTYKGTLGINTWEPPKNDVNLKLYVSGNAKITGTLHVGQFAPTSDERLKTDIRSLTIEEKDKLYLLEGKFYNKIIQIEDNTNLIENIVDSVIYNGIDTCGIVQIRTITENPKQIFHVTEYGYLAQDIQNVFPDLVSQDAEGYYGVNYIGLIPVVVEAMKDQKGIIETQ
jgi:hypothetical protein